MIDEVKAAARWWADCLRELPAHDVGDENLNIHLLFASLSTGSVPPEKADRFEAALVEHLPAFLRAHAWDEAVLKGEPCWGGYGRILCTDYGPQGLLAEVAAAVGITGAMLRFPSKTVMWVNPGEVQVARGYRAPPVTIYPAPPETPAD